MDPRTDRIKCVKDSENPYPQKLQNRVFAWEGLHFSRFPASSTISKNCFNMEAEMSPKSRTCRPKAFEKLAWKTHSKKHKKNKTSKYLPKGDQKKWYFWGFLRSGGKGAPRVVPRGLPGTLQGQIQVKKVPTWRVKWKLESPGQTQKYVNIMILEIFWVQNLDFGIRQRVSAWK